MSSASRIKNKIVRERVHNKEKSLKNKEKLARRQKEKEDRKRGIEPTESRHKTRTIENSKVPNATAITDPRDEELLQSQQTDEFENFFKQPATYEPKLLLTTSRSATSVSSITACLIFSI